MNTRNQYRLLIWVLLISMITTTTLGFTEGLHILWPLSFGVGTLVSAWFFGTWMAQEKLKKEAA